jgi:hypothetical protein
MKNIKLKTASALLPVVLLLLVCCSSGLRAEGSAASDTSAATPKHQGKLMEKFRAMKPVKFTFDDNLILDNQSVMVPKAQGFEFELQHRFGVVTNGYKDFLGIFNAANVRVGMNYTPCTNLQIGFGFNKYNLTWDFDAKYALMKQSEAGKGIWPLSITAFGNAAVDTRSKDNFVRGLDRMSYFGEIMIARKFTKHLSIQISGNISYFNNVPGYVNVDGGVSPLMKNANFSVAAMGRYKFNDKIGILLEYNQPLTQNPSNNPHPNLGIGVEFSTGNHDFQITFSNYGSIIPQVDNTYNQNDYQKGAFCLGFNMSRLWFL